MGNEGKDCQAAGTQEASLCDAPGVSSCAGVGEEDAVSRGRPQGS